MARLRNHIRKDKTVSTRRLVRPDDVGKVLSVRCLCGCGREPDTGTITAYVRNAKSNAPQPQDINPHDRFIIVFPDSDIPASWSIDGHEVVDDSP